MTAPPANSDEDLYMDESFDEESPSEIEEEPDADFLEDSDSHSDAEAEFLRGNVSAPKADQLQELTVSQFSLNPTVAPHASSKSLTEYPQPHARRQLMYGKHSGGGSGFPRDKLAYASSSDDEGQVVVRKTFAEVNYSNISTELVNDGTSSERTIVPDETHEYVLDNYEMDEQENEQEDEIIYEDQLKDEQHKAPIDTKSNSDSDKNMPTDELIDIVDCEETASACSDDDVKIPLDSSSHNDMETNSNPEPMKSVPVAPEKDDYMSDPQMEGVSVVEVPTPPGRDPVEFPIIDERTMANAEAYNAKFLEHKLTQMSQLIMSTYLERGGSPDSEAFESLTAATKMMQARKILEEFPEETESISTIESTKTPSTVRSEKDSSVKCRCPSVVTNDEVQGPLMKSFLMDECGQGDGLMRYPHAQQTNSGRLNCRVTSTTPTSFNSSNCNYHINIRRPPSSSTSTEKVNYRNAGRKSFSFTNPQVREIKRQNNLLLEKIKNVKPTIKSTASSVKSSPNLPGKNVPPPAPRLSSAAVNRKKHQRQIDMDNERLMWKLEAVGSRRPIFK